MKDNTFFFEFKQTLGALKQGLGKRFLRLLGLLLLIVLPISVVNAYTSATLAQSIFSVLPQIDFSNPESLQILLNAASNSAQGGLAELLLSIIISLLQCAVYIIATVYTWQCLGGKNDLIDDSNAFVKLILKKLPAVFLVTYFASYVLSYTLSVASMTASMFFAVPISFIAVPLAAITMFFILSVATALVDSYASVFMASSITGRIRFMFAMIYTRLLYRGHFFKTVVYYTLINMVAILISAVPYAAAIYLSSIGHTAAYVVWGVASCVQCMLSGLTMCFYTARMLHLERVNESLLRPFSFVSMESQDPSDGDDGPYEQ